MWIILALAAPLFWAASNIFDKYGLSKMSKGTYEFLFLGTLGSIFISLFSFAVFGIEAFSAWSILPIAAGFCLQYSYLFYSLALGKEDASYVIPLYITYAVLVLLLSPLFGETITGIQYLAFGVVFIGALLLSLEELSFSIHRYRKGAMLMIPAIILLSFYVLLFDRAVVEIPFTDAFIFSSVGFVIGGISLMLVPRWRAEIFYGLKTLRLKKLNFFLLNDTVDLSGHIIYQYALYTAPSASLVAVLGGVQPFYVLILGTFFTLFLPHIVSEKITRKELVQKLVGTTIIAAGILLLNLY